MTGVDVVVPCYCYGHYLRQCVESVLTQTGVNVRVLIIDDASADDSAEIATDLCKRDARVNFIRHTINRGHIATYNEGIEWASAKYYMILSADDYLLPGALSRGANLMNTNPSIGLTFGQAVTITDGDSPQTPPQSGHLGGRVVPGLEFIMASGVTNVVPTPTAVVRTDLQKQLGGYRPELPHAGDMEMWLRLAAHSDIGVIDAYQAVYRRHAANMSSLYYVDMWLPDLRQRKAAIEHFMSTCHDLLPRAAEMQKKFFGLLAEEAVRYAKTAFNQDEVERCQQLCQFAVEISPQIKRSYLWKKLNCSIWLGPSVWNSLRMPILWIRQLINHNL